MLGTLTLIVPSIAGSAGDVISEGLTALSGLLSLHHAVLLRGDPTLAASNAEAARQAAGATPLAIPPETERLVRWSLSVLSNVDVVLELAVLRAGGEEARWSAVAALESVRAVLKLALLWQSVKRRGRGDADEPRHLLNGGKVDFGDSPAAAAAAAAGDAGKADATAADDGVGAALAEAWASSTEEAHTATSAAARALGKLDEELQGTGGLSNAVDGDAASLIAQSRRGAASTASGRQPARYWEGSRSGVRLRLPAAADTASAEAVGAGLDLDSATGPLRVAAEVLQALRPAVYAGGRARFPGSGSAAPWAPWLASAAMDGAAAGLVWAAERVGNGVPRSAGPVMSRSGAEDTFRWAARALGVAGPREADPAGAAGEGMLTLPQQSLAQAAASALSAASSAWTATPAAAVAASGAGGTEPAADLSSSTLSWASAGVKEIALWFISGTGARVGTLSSQEAAELRRRQWGLLLYLVRDPMWSVVTKPWLDRVLGPLEAVPLVGTVLRFVRGLAEYYQGLHAHTVGPV